MAIFHNNIINSGEHNSIIHNFNALILFTESPHHESWLEAGCFYLVAISQLLGYLENV